MFMRKPANLLEHARHTPRKRISGQKVGGVDGERW